MTNDEKIASYETLLHIKNVARFLNQMAIELMERAAVHDQSKLEEPELSTFVEYTPRLAACTYGSDEYTQFLQESVMTLTRHTPG